MQIPNFLPAPAWFQAEKFSQDEKKKISSKKWVFLNKGEKMVH